MHVILRRYAGAADRVEEAARRVQAGLVPLLKSHRGFHRYAAFASERGDIISCSVYGDAAAAARSHEQVRGWVQANLKDILPDAPPEGFSGPVGPHAIVSPQSGGPDQSLYCFVRKSENLPPAESMRPIIEAMLAAVQKAPGFRGGYFLRSADDPTRGASVLFCDTREHAAAVHEATLAIMRKNQPHVMVRVAGSGTTSVLAMA
jgi:hypothetical protein